MSLIVGEFYKGQGLGNQLFTYASIRGLAKLCDKDFAFAGVESFKGADLFDLDFGQASFSYPREKCYEVRVIDPDCGHDVGVTDMSLLRKIENAKNSIKVEGLLAAKGYWPGGMRFLREILPIKEEILCAKNLVCENSLLIHVRGGDFLYSNSILGSEYYATALSKLDMTSRDATVITDDPIYARQLLGEEIILDLKLENERHKMTADHHIGGSFVSDFLKLIYARNIILSNSSFAFWAAVLNIVGARVVAPTYWAARDCQVDHWSPGDFIFDEFEYV